MSEFGLTNPLSDDAASETALDGVEAATEPQSETTQTPQKLKQIVQALLKFGLLEAQGNASLYQQAKSHQAELKSILEPLDLSLEIDEIRGLVFLLVAAGVTEQGEDEWVHPLVRRQRLTLEQSLLVAILRQEFLSYELEAGIGAGEAKVSLDTLISHLQLYRGVLNSDMQEDKRVRNLLEQLKGHGIVSEENDKRQVTIRPIIVHVANPENLGALLDAYTATAQAYPQSE